MARQSRSGTNTENETLIRQWAMLMAIPREPAKRSVQKIRDRLVDQGHEVNVRTVQRDLNKLSSIFGYTCAADGRSQYWFFPRTSRLLSLPEMPVPTAMALLIARDEARTLMPPATLRMLEPYFSKSEEVLTAAMTGGLDAWRNRIRVISAGPDLRLPRVPDEVLQPVYDALLGGRQLDVRYRRRGATSAKQQQLHPLGLVAKKGMLYLVALTWNYDDPHHYAVHRFESAAVIEAEARQASGFNLDRYAAKAFGYPQGDRQIRLRILMDREAAFHLMECPLSDDQSIRDAEDEDDVEIQATVDDTAELRWWLLGYGDLVEVVAPVRLRREMARTAESMMRNYAR